MKWIVGGVIALLLWQASQKAADTLDLTPPPWEQVESTTYRSACVTGVKDTYVAKAGTDAFERPCSDPPPEHLR